MESSTIGAFVCLLLCNLLSGAVAQVPAPICDIQTAQTCLNDLSSSPEVLNLIHHGGILPDTRALDKACNISTKFQDCIVNNLNDCELGSRLTFDILNNTLSYICGAGRLEYEANLACFSKPGMMDGNTECVQNATIGINDVLSSPTSTETEKNAALCTIMNSGIECLRSNAATICSQGAGNFMTRLAEETYGSLRDVINCTRPTEIVQVPTCDFAGAYNCLNTVVSSPEVLALVQSGSVIGNRQTIVKMCGFANTFKLCIHDKLAQCGTNHRLMFDVIEAELNFVCGEGRPEYLSHQTCFDNPDVQNTALECVNNGTQTMNLVLSSITLQGEKANSYCGTLNEAVSCLRRIVRARCDEMASQFVDKMMEKTYQPLRTFLTCVRPVDPVTEPPTTSTTRAYASQTNRIKPATWKVLEKVTTSSAEPCGRCWARGHWQHIADMNEWCKVNCLRRNCPQSICFCGCPGQEKVRRCESIGAYREVDGADSWCRNNCVAGSVCPSYMCRCHW